MTKEIECLSLRGLSERFSIPLWTLRKWAAERKFPGIIKKGRKIYVNIEKFRIWFYKDEIHISPNQKGARE